MRIQTYAWRSPVDGTVAFARATKQSGVVLFIALIVLVAMSLAGVALVRSVDTNVMTAGNLAFRQGATLAADKAIESARSWVLTLVTPPGGSISNSYTDSPGSGYFASLQVGFDPKNYDWNNPSRAVTSATDAAGNTASRVIHRMCDLPGNPTGLNCITQGASGKASSTFGSIDYGRYPLQVQGLAIAFRITTRVLGPKNTVSYVQVVIYP